MSVHITHLISSHLTWPRFSECAVKRPSSPWLRPIRTKQVALSLSDWSQPLRIHSHSVQMERGQCWDKVRWNETEWLLWTLLSTTVGGSLACKQYYMSILTARRGGQGHGNLNPHPRASFVKFRLVVFEICVRTDRQTNTHAHAHHNRPHPCWDEITKKHRIETKQQGEKNQLH